ncbi:hypothetical protein Syun_016662 [Stephania yunnanensis]|uniref:Uncharacterized protein n=1 Tax=Stephania yunnanensis TaxID=152371 RepID=A0AAP0J6F9_9MAGN
MEIHHLRDRKNTKLFLPNSLKHLLRLTHQWRCKGMLGTCLTGYPVSSHITRHFIELLRISTHLCISSIADNRRRPLLTVADRPSYTGPRRRPPPPLRRSILRRRHHPRLLHRAQPPSFNNLAHEVITHLRNSSIPILPGLSNYEFVRAEAKFGFSFPPDLRTVLSVSLPISLGFPDWRAPTASNSVPPSTSPSPSPPL